jgi:membrane protease YdiL (CAAX protease family)
MKWRRSIIALSLMTGLLLICNVTFIRTSGDSTILWHFFGFASLYAVYTYAELTAENLGLSRRNIWSGLRYGVLCIVTLASILLAVYFIRSGIFHDPRYNKSIGAALTTALLLVPLQTVFFEEISFRGILPALITRLTSSNWTAAITSSLAFGMWHVITAGEFKTIHATGNVITNRSLTVGIILLFTSSAGLFLYYLRLRSKSLVAPIMVHWFANAFAIILTALSWKYHG